MSTCFSDKLQRDVHQDGYGNRDGDIAGRDDNVESISNKTYPDITMRCLIKDAQASKIIGEKRVTASIVKEKYNARSIGVKGPRYYRCTSVNDYWKQRGNSYKCEGKVPLSSRTWLILPVQKKQKMPEQKDHDLLKAVISIKVYLFICFVLFLEHG